MGRTSGQPLAILFTDVEGSTELLSREGDSVAGEILRVHEEIVRSRIRECGGREVAFLGDGFMAAFETARTSLECAIRIQSALEEHNRADPDRHVRVRIGLHQGEVIERDGQLYGRAVHAAARVMAEASGAQILASAAIHDACAGDPELTFVDRGLFWLKGFPERWRLYEVQWRPRGEVVDEDVPSVPALTPFVGRDAERADLRRTVRAALAGQGSLVLVSGEPGVGKTRLVEEVAAEAERRGMRALVGHCVEMEGGTPYLPFIEILEQMLVGPQSALALREALGEEAAEISRIVPGLRRLLPDMAPPLDLPAEQARRYLWTSVEEVIRRAAQTTPLLLVVEDLHWGDESTLMLLEYLTPLVGGMPVLLVGTYRDTEVGMGHPLARTIDRLVRRRLVTRASLRRLSGDGVADMLRGLAGQEPPPGLVAAIQAETEGNPFFVEEVFLHLAETGALLDESGRFRPDLRIDELDVPESVRLVVGGRLERLGETTRSTLLAAAVAGRVFEPEVVRRVAGLDPDALAAVFDEAEGARLIAPSKSDPSESAFVHELIRQTLLAGASSVKRQRLHARTADAIEAVHSEDVEDHAADLAYHLSRSGPAFDQGRLVRYLRMAGDWAVQAAAFPDAVGHFEHALAVLPDGELEARAELLERLAMARRSMGDWDEALATMDRTLELYQSLGQTEAIGRVCWSIAYQLAWAARFQEAVTVAGRGLEALGELANADRARLLSVTAWVVGLAGDHDTADGMFHEARRLAEELGDKRALADVLHMETPHHMGYVEFEQGIEAGRRASIVFESEGELWDLCSVLAFVQFQQGTITLQEEAAELAERVTPLARRLGHLGAQFLDLADRIRREGVMAGDLSRTEELAHQEIEVCRRGNLPWLYTGHLYLGFVEHWRGRPDEAERHVRTAMELEPPGAFGGQSAAHLALLLAERGREDEVRSLFEAGRQGLARAGRVNSLGAWNTLLTFTEALYLVGEQEEVVSLRPLLEEAGGLTGWVTFDCRLVQTRAGIAAAAEGRWEEAERHYAAALSEAGRLGHRIEQADVLRLRARMLRDRTGAGDEEEALRLLEEASAGYRALGLTRHADLVAGDRRGERHRRLETGPLATA